MSCSCKNNKADSFGIIGAEFYFPKSYVDQRELEKHEEAGNGKYTKGFGQLEMSFCHENEDVCSMALTATSALLANNEIKKNQIGFLAVGTETLNDKSKSVRTVLMDLFDDSHNLIGTGSLNNNQCNGSISNQINGVGHNYNAHDDGDDNLSSSSNMDIEGADLKNACFGGTQALFHAVDWLVSNWEFEGRYAIVVCADVAIYAKGPARCTGGAGAIAFLLGPNSPLVIEPGLRAFYSRNVYDFYKPIAGQSSEYPVVFGATSIDEYMHSVQKCYKRFKNKFVKRIGKEPCIADFYATLFHSPYTRLTQKAFCSLIFADIKKGQTTGITEKLLIEKLKHYNYKEVPNSEMEREKSRPFWDDLMLASKNLMDKSLEPHLEFNRRLGNMYTLSLYAQLLNAINNTPCKPKELDQQRILLYSYGSGSIAAIFSIRFNFPNGGSQNSAATQIAYYESLRRSAQNAFQQLQKREEIGPEEFEKILGIREEIVREAKEYTEEQSKSKLNVLFSGAYYLQKIDSNKRRFYAKNNICESR